jgi:hypothetical protein
MMGLGDAVGLVVVRLSREGSGLWMFYMWRHEKLMGAIHAGVTCDG